MELTGNTATSRFMLAAKNLFGLLFPARCIACHGAVSPAIEDGVAEGDGCDICASCMEEMPLNEHCCPQCAVPLAPDHPSDVLCGRCIKTPPSFDYSINLYRYEGSVVSLVHQLKFSQKISHAGSLSALLAQAYHKHVDKEDSPDCLLPVPLHKRRLRQRGFNQSTELVRTLATSLRVPVVLEGVDRVRQTESQTGLDARQRVRNIRGAFSLVPGFNYEHVLIIDDVVTTGSTVNELARLLKKNGVKRVGVLSLARAPMKQ